MGRQRVLEAIAAAQAGAAAGFDTAAHPATSTAYEVHSAADVDVVDLLIDRTEDYRARVVDLRAVEDEQTVATAVTAVLRENGARSVVVDPAFPSGLRPARVTLVEDHGLSHAALDGVDAAVTTCAVAIAETGTIILDHGPGQGRRAITLLPDLHVCLVRTDQVHGAVPEALRALGPRALTTWISGPSATSDIELSRVEGVHGPRRLVVVIHS